MEISLHEEEEEETQNHSLATKLLLREDYGIW